MAGRLFHRWAWQINYVKLNIARKIMDNTDESDRYYRIKRQLEDELREVLKKYLSEELEKRFWKLGTLVTAVSISIVILGYSTWQNIPQIAKSAAVEAVKAEATLKTVEKVKEEAEDISSKHEEVIVTLNKIKTNINETSNDVARNLLQNSRFLKNIRTSIVDILIKDQSFQSIVKGKDGDSADNLKIAEILSENKDFQNNVKGKDGLDANIEAVARSIFNDIEFQNLIKSEIDTKLKIAGKVNGENTHSGVKTETIKSTPP